MQNAYATTTGGTLDVFCVSNKHYEKFSRNGDVEYVRKTGIPELRRFCHSLTATSQFMGAKHYLESRLPSLLNSIKLVAEVDPEEDNLTSPESERRIEDGFKTLRREVRYQTFQKFES